MIETIYLDNAATTKPIPQVIEAINNCLQEGWGNPSSIHDMGRTARAKLEATRRTVADFVGAKSEEIIFTSGASESNSLAICGFLKKRKIITSAIEHSSIMEIANDYAVTDIVPVDGRGMVDVDQLEHCLIGTGNSLVSIQWANGEVGTIQNMDEISEVVHKYNGVLHTDATQIIPDRPIDVNGIDMMSFSGQKFGTPKGVGVLYVRNGIKLSPIIYGMQERGLRGGTENVPYIAGLGEAIKQLSYPKAKVRNHIAYRLLSEVDGCYIVGDVPGDNRLKNHISLCFTGIEGEALLLLLSQKGIYVSTGSACSSGSSEPSRVLKEIGIPTRDLHSVIRITTDIGTSIQDGDIAVDEIKHCVQKLRKVAVF